MASCFVQTSQVASYSYFSRSGSAPPATTAGAEVVADIVFRLRRRKTLPRIEESMLHELCGYMSYVVTMVTM